MKKPLLLILVGSSMLSGKTCPIGAALSGGFGARPPYHSIELRDKTGAVFTRLADANGVLWIHPGESPENIYHKGALGGKEQWK